jgi:hypothetical protein
MVLAPLAQALLTPQELTIHSPLPAAFDYHNKSPQELTIHSPLSAAFGFHNKSNGSH